MDWEGLIKELAILGLIFFVIYKLLQCIKYSLEFSHRKELQEERQSHEKQILSIRQDHEKELRIKGQKHEVIMYLIKEGKLNNIFETSEGLNKLLSHYDIQDGKDKDKASKRPDT